MITGQRLFGVYLEERDLLKSAHCMRFDRVDNYASKPIWLFILYYRMSAISRTSFCLKAKKKITNSLITVLHDKWEWKKTIIIPLLQIIEFNFHIFHEFVLAHKCVHMHPQAQEVKDKCY